MKSTSVWCLRTSRWRIRNRTSEVQKHISCLRFFFYFNSLNSPFLGSESFRQDIGQFHSSRADETFANRWIILSTSISILQWIWCKASPNHLPDFNLENFLLILENIFIMKKLSDFRKFVETGVDPRLR